MTYVDGFVVPVPKDRLEDYKKLASAAGKVWLEYGALSFTEAVADDVPYGELTSFPRAVMAKIEEETVIFAWITYRSRQHRDEVNAKVMADTRIKEQMEGVPMPFDGKRMIYGGFQSVVEY